MAGESVAGFGAIPPKLDSSEEFSTGFTGDWFGGANPLKELPAEKVGSLSFCADIVDGCPKRFFVILGARSGVVSSGDWCLRT